MNGSVQNILLPSQFTIDCLPAIYDQLSTFFNDSIPFLLDGSDVERIDGAAIQFLVMCQCHLPSLEDDLMFSANECVQQGIRELGFQELIGITDSKHQGCE